KNLDTLKNHDLKFKIVSFDKKRSNIVLSRRAVVEVEQQHQKAETFSRLEEGKLTHGVVKNITDYGVFVDLGGVDGLLHITDISWGRVGHPSEYFNVGDEIEVKVLKFDPQNERVSLGYKQKSPDPWSDVQQRYPLGSRVKGKVVSLTDYGAFVELEEGVEGLIHVSEMSWTKKVRNPSKILSIGDEVEAVVGDVNTANRRISLSLRALEQNPWETVADRYPVGSVITGRVRNLTDFGAFVEVEDGIDGLIHISDMSWNRRIKHPSEVLKKGDSVQARVINVDAENQRLSLSVREFLPNGWDDFAKTHQVGDDVIGNVSKITDFGIFVRLADGVEALAHISEITREGKAKLERLFQPGDALRARIIKMDAAERKIGLTLRDVEPLTEEERAHYGETHEPEHEEAPAEVPPETDAQS
ncbi:MAG TPA: 30S ribosomal protein S1, partial [Thermoanaerobaculia bacterium]|nr:30S ribosomal protein S1 [Thermoanaerobaculia bacterium]